MDAVWPEPRKNLPPRPTALDPYKPVVDEILRTDLDAPRKQCHMITRIFHRFLQEHSVDVSSPMVRALRLRPESGDPRGLGQGLVGRVHAVSAQRSSTRLTFKGTIIETGTDSYRLATTRARAERTPVAD